MGVFLYLIKKQIIILFFEIYEDKDAVSVQSNTSKGVLEVANVYIITQTITYFIRKTTYSNRKFDIIDRNK